MVVDLWAGLWYNIVTMPTKKSSIKTPAKKRAHTAPSVPPSLALYRRIAVGFIIAAGTLFSLVVLLSTTRVTIKIDPREETVKTEFLVELKSDGQEQGIAGKIIEAELKGEKLFNVTSEGATEVPSKAGGIVAIKNISNRSQQLVATTRLLSQDGTLFRIDEGVIVPAQGSIDVMAHADVSGKAGEIGPSKFTVPGLNESRQQEVYAESSSVMTGGTKIVSMLKQEEIDASATALAIELLDQAKATIVSDTDKGSLGGEAVVFENLEYSSEPEVGAEIDSFVVSVNALGKIVSFDKQKVLEFAEAKLYEAIPRGKELIRVNRDNMQIILERVDADSGTARLRVVLEGTAIVSPTSDALSKENLIGLSAQAVADRLVKGGVAVSVKVVFFPAWIKRIPKWKDHIWIEILRGQ